MGQRLKDHARGGIIAIAIAVSVGIAIAGTTLKPQAFDFTSFTKGIRIGSMFILPPKTTNELLTTDFCDEYPTVRCVVYNTDEDCVFSSTSTTGWFSICRGTFPGDGP